MKKIILFMIVAAALLLTACGADSAEEWEVPNFGSGPVADAHATEPTDNTGERFNFGQEVWSVRRSDDGGDAYVVRYAVVAQDGDLIAVVPMFTTDADDMREALENAAQMPLDGSGHLYLVERDNCYLTPEEAETAADRENGEG